MTISSYTSPPIVTPYLNQYTKEGTKITFANSGKEDKKGKRQFIKPKGGGDEQTK